MCVLKNNAVYNINYVKLSLSPTHHMKPAIEVCYVSHVSVICLTHHCHTPLFRKRGSLTAKDEYLVAGVKDSLLPHTPDPVEMRRLNYQTQGMDTHTHTHAKYFCHQHISTRTQCPISIDS